VHEDYILPVLTALIAGSSAWGATRTALNGTKDRVKEIILRQASDEKVAQESLQRISSAEAKLDLVINRQTEIRQRLEERK
jgi:hypothetical protein